MTQPIHPSIHLLIDWFISPKLLIHWFIHSFIHSINATCSSCGRYRDTEPPPKGPLLVSSLLMLPWPRLGGVSCLISFSYRDNIPPHPSTRKHSMKPNKSGNDASLFILICLPPYKDHAIGLNSPVDWLTLFSWWAPQNVISAFFCSNIRLHMFPNDCVCYENILMFFFLWSFKLYFLTF